MSSIFYSSCVPAFISYFEGRNKIQIKASRSLHISLLRLFFAYFFLFSSLVEGEESFSNPLAPFKTFLVFVRCFFEHVESKNKEKKKAKTKTGSEEVKVRNISVRVRVRVRLIVRKV